MNYDFMAIGAHPDDVEVGMGATLAKMVSLGRKGVLIDMTDGGAGTQGSATLRHKEATRAAKILGVERFCLSLPDAELTLNQLSVAAVIQTIRKYRPRIVFTHYFQDEHPDHYYCAQIVKEAFFKAGLKKITLAGAAYRPQRLFHFPGFEYYNPLFCVDVSEYWQTKVKALECYPSQFYVKHSKSGKGRTDLSKPAFWSFIEARARFLGSRIKQKYAEGFICSELPEVIDPCALGGDRFP